MRGNGIVWTLSWYHARLQRLSMVRGSEENALLLDD